MLDLKFIRQNPEVVREALRKRGEPAPLDELLSLDERRREILVEVEALKKRRNEASEEVARIKRSGGDPSAVIEEMRVVSDRIKAMDDELRDVEARVNELLLHIPNIPHESVPVGKDESENVEVRRWGEPRKFDFPPKAHWDLGTSLGILDFERASKITGARFTVFNGLGARMVRALISFMIDLHTQEHGYKEVYPPFLVNRESMLGTGQLPKFEEDLFKCQGTDFYLVPTAEVPVTNLHRGEVLDAQQLPLYYVAYTACFRAEAGAAGRDTRGLIRQHEFDKVEMVKLVEPATSDDELMRLIDNAEDVCRRLGLPYRVVQMCTGDLSFTAAAKYDIEVWAAGCREWLEVSSCSNFGDFQARRANIRYRPAVGARPEYVHTLNGSGLALPRVMIAILENYQRKDGSVVVPEVLRPYMGGAATIG